MALTVTLLGVSYSVPESGDSNYDTALTAYLKALATAFPQLSGGVNSLTAELDFGTSFGLKAAWYKSETVNPASAGQVRLAKTDSLKFRNNANGADLALAIDTGDALTWNGANVTGNPLLDATTSAGQSITSGASTIVIFGTVVTDSDSAYNSGTGRYTVPAGKGGDYLITSAIVFSAASGVNPSLQIFKNGAALRGSNSEANTPGANATIKVTGVVRLAAADVIDIRALQSSGGPVTLNVTAAFNYFSLKRIPT